MTSSKLAQVLLGVGTFVLRHRQALAGWIAGAKGAGSLEVASLQATAFAAV